MKGYYTFNGSFITHVVAHVYAEDETEALRLISYPGNWRGVDEVQREAFIADEESIEYDGDDEG